MRTPRIAVIGAGMSGLAMGIALRSIGVSDFVIYEKGDRVGGTWRDNRYPGVACDVPSYFYQFSFAPNPDWSRFFSPGEEIEAYLEDIADRFDVRRHVRLGTAVVDATFSEPRWTLTLADGTQDDVDFVVSATGILHHPQYPDIEGLPDFKGDSFHTARWDDSVELAGKRVGIIGTGSTSVQIITALAPVADTLTVFQRTPQWIFPLPNGEVPATVRRALSAVSPLNQAAYRAARNVVGLFNYAVVQPGWQRDLVTGLVKYNLNTVRDPELRAKLTPDYLPMCRRLVMSGGFYPAIQQPNVDVVVDGIERVTESGVVTRDGVEHELDVLVLATGFDAHAFMRPLTMTGRDGMTLDKAWADGPRGYKTVALPDFPNFFMIMGPHSPVGNTSLTLIAETQANYIATWIERWRQGEFDTLAPTAEAAARFNADVKAAMPATIWASGCTSWYLGKDGTPELWPWVAQHHQTVLAEPDASEFVFTGRTSPQSRRRPGLTLPTVPLPAFAARTTLRAVQASVFNAALPVPVGVRRFATEVVSRAVSTTPRDVRVDRTTLGAVPVHRFSTPESDPSRACLYLHGGGYHLGSAATHHTLVAALTVELGVPVYLVDYRRAPEHSSPAALDDAFAAYQGLLAAGLDGESLAIVGDSAGGGLALALAQKVRDGELPAAGVVGLISPWLDLSLSETAAAPGRRDPLLTMGLLRSWARSYAGTLGVDDPRVSPLRGDLSHLPPLVVHVGTDDLLYRDALRLAERLTGEGRQPDLRVLDKAPHVVHLFAGRVRQGTQAVRDLADDLRKNWDASH